MTHTETQLKQLLALLLPNLIEYHYAPAEKFESPYGDGEMELKEEHNLIWKELPEDSISGFVRDTELLELCRVVEEGLSEEEHIVFRQKLWAATENEKASTIYDDNTWNRNYISSSYQQRIPALAEVRGVKI